MYFKFDTWEVGLEDELDVKIRDTFNGWMKQLDYYTRTGDGYYSTLERESSLNKLLALAGEKSLDTSGLLSLIQSARANIVKVEADIRTTKLECMKLKREILELQGSG